MNAKGSCRRVICLMVVALTAISFATRSANASIVNGYTYDLNVSNTFSTNAVWGTVNLSYDTDLKVVTIKIANTYAYDSLNNEGFDGFGFNTSLALLAGNFSGDLGSDWESDQQLDGFGKFVVAELAGLPRDPTINVLVDIGDVIGSATVDAAWLDDHFAVENAKGNLFAAHYAMGVDNTIDGTEAGSHWVAAQPAIPEPASIAVWTLLIVAAGLGIAGYRKRR